MTAVLSRTASFCSLAVTLAGVSVGAGALSAGAVETIACGTGLPASSMGLFDGHDHLRNITTAPEGEAELDELAAAGVALGMLALATPDSVANGAALDMQSESAYPVYAFARAPYSLVGGKKTFDSTSLGVVIAQLQAGATGVGEIPLRHSGPTGLAANIAANHPVAMAIYAEAGSRRVPVSIHFETRDKSAPGVDISSRIDELEAALSAYPETRFIWAHLGDTGPTTVRTLIEAHGNLYGDLSTRNPYYIRGWPMGLQSLGTGTDGSGGLGPEWKSLFEDHPDRFLFGLDLASDDRREQLDQVVTYYRGVLGELSQETAEKIACKNARELLTTAAVPGPSRVGLWMLALLVIASAMVHMRRRHIPL
ncbi:MAG: amidohydrolase family protein [Myxococcota bacterium]|nr:amidohydrolase family protein [Myxococcota bacterium]